MDELVFSLTDALSASAAVAIGAALLWGALSVLLSPCHLGTIPLVVGFVSASGHANQPGSWRRAAALSFSFAGGMLLAIVILGAIAGTLGYAVSGLGALTNYLIAAIFIVAGLHLMGLVHLPLSGLSVTGTNRRGRFAAFLLGLVLGVGLSPCTFAFLAPILALTFGSAAKNPALGAALLLAFGVGHCGVIGLAGSSADLVQRYLDWNERSRAIGAVKGLCGALVLASAGLLIYTA